MELEIVFVFHCNPCQLKKSFGRMDAGIGKGGGEASPKSESRRGRFRRKKQHLRIFSNRFQKLYPFGML